MKQRDTYLDAVGGIMILYMIYGHICLWTELRQFEVLSRLLFFFMPWFFFKSGMFYRKVPMREVVMKGWKRLLVPYLVFSIVGYVAFAIMQRNMEVAPVDYYLLNPLRQMFHEGAVAGNSPVWFLFSLFIVRILFTEMQKLKRFLSIGIALLGALGYLLNIMEVKDYFYISNIITGTFFFGLGYFCKEIQFDCCWFVVSLIVYGTIIIIDPSYIDFRSNSGSGHYLLWMISAFAGIITVNNILKILPYSFPFLSTIGRGSMAYYVLHWPIMALLVVVIRQWLEVENGIPMFWIHAVGVMLFSYLVDKLLQKKMRWIMGS